MDPVKKEVVACFPEDTGMDELCFRVPYDILVLGRDHFIAVIHCSPGAFQTLGRPLRLMSLSVSSLEFWSNVYSYKLVDVCMQKAF